jgi:hypothetical protein
MSPFNGMATIEGPQTANASCLGGLIRLRRALSSTTALWTIHETTLGRFGIITELTPSGNPAEPYQGTLAHFPRQRQKKRSRDSVFGSVTCRVRYDPCQTPTQRFPPSLTLLHLTKTHPPSHESTSAKYHVSHLGREELHTAEISAICAIYITNQRQQKCVDQDGTDV